MNVLIMNPSFDVYGGAERLIVALANYLESQSVWPTILTSSMSDKVRRNLSNTRLIISGSGNARALPGIASEIAHDFDVLNPHNAPAHLWGYPSRSRVVWMCNEPPHEYLRTGTLTQREIDATNRYVSMPVVADEFNRDRYREIYGKDARVVNYGVNGQWFSEGKEDSQDVRYYHRLKGDYVLHVGYMTFTKNQVRTVQIYREALDKGLDADLVFAGPVSSYTSEVRKMADQLSVSDRVRILGELSQDEIRDLYHQARCAVFPIQAQGGWLSVFEAIATGAPVMVSDEFTGVEIARDLASVGTSNDEFSDFMIDPVPNKDGAVGFVVSELTWDKYCERMYRIFREVSGE